MDPELVKALAHEIQDRGLGVEQQKVMPFTSGGIRYSNGLKLDLLVEGVVPVELKAVEALAPVHFRQILTYLRLLDLPIGFLLNFGAARLKDGGIRRILNNYRPRVDYRKHAPDRHA